MYAVDTVFLQNYFQQEQKLISLLDTVLVNAWKDFIELICSRNVTNVDKVD